MSAVTHAPEKASRVGISAAGLWILALVAALLAAPAGFGQTGLLPINGGVIDFSSATTSTRPIKTGGSLPATCTVLQMFGLTTNNSVWWCDSTNHWAQFGSSSGNGAIRTIGATLTPTALTACIYVGYNGTIQTGSPYGFHAVALDGASSTTVLVKVQTQATFATWLSTGLAGTTDISSGGESLSAVLGKADTALSGWTLGFTAGTTFCFVASGFSAGSAVNVVINVLAN
jgi:hypothetical protein